MDDHCEPGFFQLPEALFKDLQRIAAVYPFGGSFMDGLEPQLHPHRFDLIQFPQHFKNLFRKAVGPCPEREDRDFFPENGFGIQLPQTYGIAVGIGKGLEVGDELFRICFCLDPGFRLFQLFLKWHRFRRELTGAAF